jgi:hypothetical protein
MRYFVLAASLAVTGCAPSLVGSNERGGMISHVSGMNRDDAFSLADRHCRQFGRAARISGQSALDSTMTFDCVQ